MTLAYTLIEASDRRQFDLGRDLFREYAVQLDVDLCFQGFDRELEQLSVMYGPPSGCLVLVFHEETAVGCGAVRNLSDRICEMKRLYLRSGHRGSGIGRRLALHLLDRAQRLGYRSMRLDTLRGMTSARQLYASLGFRQIPAYYDNPLTDCIYLERTLGRAAGDAAT